MNTTKNILDKKENAYLEEKETKKTVEEYSKTIFTKGYAQGYEKGFKEGQMFLIQKFKTTLDSVEEILKSQKS